MLTAGPADAPSARHERLALAGLLVAITVLHAAFVLHGFGEADATRLGRDAVLWHHTGELRSEWAGYRARTSLLYIALMKSALDLGLPPASLPSLVNWLSVGVSTAALGALYALWRRHADALATLVACGLYALVPAFWVAGLYGMAHLPAFAALLGSVLAYRAGLDRPPVARAGLRALAGVAMIAACGLKLDVVLFAGVFLWAKQRWRWRELAAPAIIVAAGVGTTLLVARVLLPEVAPLGELGERWSSTFPLSFEALVARGNLGIVVGSVGPVLLAGIVLAVVAAGRERATRRLWAMTLAWALPSLLFWGMRPGNSARHIMAGIAPLVLLFAVVALARLRSPKRMAVGLSLLLVTNYVSQDRSTNPVAPTARLFDGAVRMDRRVRWLRERGEAAWLAPGARKLALGTWSNEEIVWAAVAGSARVSVEGDAPPLGEHARFCSASGDCRDLAWAYVGEQEARTRLADILAAGWQPCSIEYDFANGAAPLP